MTRSNKWIISNEHRRFRATSAAPTATASSSRMAGGNPFEFASRIAHHHASGLPLARHTLNSQLSTLNSPLAFPQGLGELGRDLVAAADSECFDEREIDCGRSSAVPAD